MQPVHALLHAAGDGAHAAAQRGVHLLEQAGGLLAMVVLGVEHEQDAVVIDGQKRTIGERCAAHGDGFGPPGFLRREAVEHQAAALRQGRKQLMQPRALLRGEEAARQRQVEIMAGDGRLLVGDGPVHAQDAVRERAVGVRQGAVGILHAGQRMGERVERLGGGEAREEHRQRDGDEQHAAQIDEHQPAQRVQAVIDHGAGDADRHAGAAADDVRAERIGVRLRLLRAEGAQQRAVRRAQRDADLLRRAAGEEERLQLFHRDERIHDAVVEPGHGVDDGAEGAL